MPSKYLPPIKYLGGAAVLIVLFGLIFPFLSDTFLSEELENEVLVQSIPFVTIFIAIILMFILFIFMVALTFNGKIPYRTYQPIEYITIVGIIVGVICLFQPWQIVAYKYGFTLLLGAMLSFITWSHVIPRSQQHDQTLPPFEAKQTYLAAAVAGLVLVALALALIIPAKPEEPYGYSQRQWDRGLNETQKAAIIEKEENTFTRFTIPFLVAWSAFPAGVVFFITRELALMMEKPTSLVQVPATS